jgi:multidrug transporter EmrE-like cation transporter
MTTMYLVLAIVAEAGWALAMKASNGLTRPVATAVTIVLYVVSLALLSLATKKMEVGTAYAIWAGSGAVLIAIAGIVWFKEPAGAIKLISIGVIAIGIAGLHLGGK